jgi:hypothetical protein
MLSKKLALIFGFLVEQSALEPSTTQKEVHDLVISMGHDEETANIAASIWLEMADDAAQTLQRFDADKSN